MSEIESEKTEKQKRQEAKDARVAQALRDNLRRRKQATKKAKLAKRRE